MSFEQNLAEKTAHCEKVLTDMLPSVEGLQGTDRYAAVVVDAMQYSVIDGGQRGAGRALYGGSGDDPQLLARAR